MPVGKRATPKTRHQTRVPTPLVREQRARAQPLAQALVRPPVPVPLQALDHPPRLAHLRAPAPAPRLVRRQHPAKVQLRPLVALRSLVRRSLQHRP
jgi:hypothetical protein